MRPSPPPDAFPLPISSFLPLPECVVRTLSPPLPTFFYRKEGGSQIRPRPTDRPVDLRAISVAPIRRSPVCHVSRSTVSLAARRTKEEKRLWIPLPPIKNATRDICMQSQGQSRHQDFFIMHLKEEIEGRDGPDRKGAAKLYFLATKEGEGFFLRRVQSFAICAVSFFLLYSISTAPFKKDLGLAQFSFLFVWLLAQR